MVRNSTVELCGFFSSVRFKNTRKVATPVEIENLMVQYMLNVDILEQKFKVATGQQHDT